MADFTSHITGSTIVGAFYGYWGVTSQNMSFESGLLAGGLCAVAGMMPDLDSENGVPLREISMFVATIAPMLMIDRFRDWEMSQESMAVGAIVVYIAIRFVVVEIFSRFTVHRGMWHSLPAAASVGLIAYLLMPSPSEAVRIYKSAAVVLGFITHLVMDEMWAIDVYRGFRLKKSFGTALKFFGTNPMANAVVYGTLFLLLYLAWNDHSVVERLRHRVELDRQYIAQPPPMQPYMQPPWR
jgi:membrane-bound metal-dependent hydrolase YbcI (DUF457 family)